MPLHSVLQQDCLALRGREPAHSCNQIRAGNASWNSPCSAERWEQLHTEPSQVWRSLLLCSLCLTNEAILLSGLKPALRVIEQLWHRVAPEVRGSPDCGSAWSHVTVQQCSHGSCVDADNPCQAQHCSSWSLCTCG